MFADMLLVAYLIGCMIFFGIALRGNASSIFESQDDISNKYWRALVYILRAILILLFCAIVSVVSWIGVGYHLVIAPND